MLARSVRTEQLAYWYIDPAPSPTRLVKSEDMSNVGKTSIVQWNKPLVPYNRMISHSIDPIVVPGQLKMIADPLHNLSVLSSRKAR